MIHARAEAGRNIRSATGRDLFRLVRRLMQRMKPAFLLLLPALAAGATATWPDAIGAFHKNATAQAVLTDKPLWDELGLKESESAVYENGKSKFTATVYRLADSTAALAAFDWRRPADAKPSKLADLAV